MCVWIFLYYLHVCRYVLFPYSNPNWLVPHALFFDFLVIKTLQASLSLHVFPLSDLMVLPILHPFTWQVPEACPGCSAYGLKGFWGHLSPLPQDGAVIRARLPSGPH